MNQRMSIPEELDARGFRVSAARAAGVSEYRARQGDLATPFHGARARETPTTVLERAHAYAPLMPASHAFGGPTAAAILGLPLPKRLAADTELTLALPSDATPPRRRGVRGRRIDAARLATISVDGLRVTSPTTTWALLARVCSVHELAVVGDALVARFEHYPGRRLPGPLASIDDLRATLPRWRRCSGIERLTLALELVRERVESPMETRTRLAIVAGGLPEPEIQLEIRAERTGALIGRADMGYRSAKVLIEFEGDHHRGKEQWATDITKYAALEREGWSVVRVLARDLFPNANAFVAQLKTLVATRQSRR